MADDQNKPKVGVYGDDATTATVEPTTSETKTETSTTPDEKSGGLPLPTWAIGLIILAVVVLAIIIFF